ncbi:MAG: hypothetical protein ACXU86_10550, partial [Archangium sp.]
MTPTIADLVKSHPEVLVILAALLLLWSRVHLALYHLTAWCDFWGAFRTTRVLADFLERRPLADWMKSSLWRMELDAHSALGNTQQAVAGARQIAAHAKADGCTHCANCAVNIFINAGLYLEALDIERGWQGPSAPEEPSAAQEWALVQFNLVEAVYNLGGWDAANARLTALEEQARRYPFLWNFFPVQRGWILAHTGQGEDALAALEK